MRVVALLCLLFGFVGLSLLDGQTLTHAATGIFFGAAAFACGMASARLDPRHRWEGWIMAALGVVLGLWCIVLLPSAYRFQKEFNGRTNQRQQAKPANQPAVKEPAIRPGFIFMRRVW